TSKHPHNPGGCAAEQSHPFRESRITVVLCDSECSERWACNDFDCECRGWHAVVERGRYSRGKLAFDHTPFDIDWGSGRRSAIDARILLNLDCNQRPRRPASLRIGSRDLKRAGAYSAVFCGGHDSAHVQGCLGYGGSIGSIGVDWKL